MEDKKCVTSSLAYFQSLDTSVIDCYIVLIFTGNNEAHSAECILFHFRGLAVISIKIITDYHDWREDISVAATHLCDK